MPDTPLVHLTNTRTILQDEITWCDQREHELRGELDQIIETRGQKNDALQALNLLILNHFTTDSEPAPTPPAAPAPSRIEAIAASQAARAAQRVVCDVCGREFSLAGIGPHRKKHARAAAPEVPTPAALPAEVPTEPASELEVPAVPADTKKPGRPRTVDYDEAAQVIADGHAAGVMPLLALMNHYKKPPAFANSLIRSLRRVGMMPEGPKANIRIVEDTTDPDQASPPDTPVIVPPAAAGAGTFREAVRANRRPIQTIVDRYDCTREQAQEWVDAARAAGELPPKGEPVLPATDAPMQFVSRS